MIGRIATVILLLIILQGIQVYSWFFLTGGLEEESISEKIGCLCCAFSFFFPIAIVFAIVHGLIKGGLL